MGGLFGVSFQRRHRILLVCSILLGSIVFLCAGCYNGRNRLANGWMERTDPTDWIENGWDGGNSVSTHNIGSATIGS